MIYLLVGLGGFLGAISRYFFYSINQPSIERIFPISTFLVNVIGCFAAGLLLGLNIPALSSAKSPTNLFVIFGFLGSFTTFSTFGVDCLKLVHENRINIALLNVFLNVAVCFVSVFLGFYLGKKLQF